MFPTTISSSTEKEEDQPEPIKRKTFFEKHKLQEIELSHKPIFDNYFQSCSTLLSDYTFANTYIWKDSIHLKWKIIQDNLCVFANGDKGLSMLFPPLGFHNIGTIDECMNICQQYNNEHNSLTVPRVEYISQDFLSYFRTDRFELSPMSGDYIYSTEKMISLEGSDLSSKRQSKNRFIRRYSHHVENYDKLNHLGPCIELLCQWQEQSSPSSSITSIKREKETSATIKVLENNEELELRGMVLFAEGKLIGFTFGELLGRETCNILVEKTDREYVGSAQFIFSEFCKNYWADTKECNVGDDWEVESLKWTKMSYRPVKRLPKWTAKLKEKV